MDLHDVSLGGIDESEPDEMSDEADLSSGGCAGCVVPVYGAHGHQLKIRTSLGTHLSWVPLRRAASVSMSDAVHI